MSDFRSDFHKLLMETELPSTMPFEEQKAKMAKLTSLVNDNIPDKMFRYRSFNCRNYKAFCKNEVFAQSPVYYNDPYDSFVCYDRVAIIDNMQYGASAESVLEIKKQLDMGGELPSDLREVLGQRNSEEYKRRLKKSSKSQLHKLLKSVKNAIPPYLKNADDIMQSATAKIQANAAILCFSETVQSILMWSHYADSHKGYALEYDNRNMQTRCERCDKYISGECNDWIVANLYPVVYSNSRYDATKFALGALKVELSNIFGGDAVAHPDLLTETKAFLHKSTDWSYEREWRIVFKRKEYCSYGGGIPLSVQPKAIYYGTKIDPGHKERLHKQAISMGLKEYEMYIDVSSSLYQLEYREI